MPDSEIIKLLKGVNAVITDDHFVLSSGRHSSIYINKDALYPHTGIASKVGEMMATINKDLDIDTVAGPALGGIILSQWTAFHLSRLKGSEVLGQFSEKTVNNDQVFTRGYDKLIKGKQVLVVEDMTTTGGSVKKVVDSVRNVGGNVVAVCVMVNRDPEKVNSDLFGVKFTALADYIVDSYTEEECSMCKKGIPVNPNLGHGKKYLEKKGGK